MGMFDRLQNEIEAREKQEGISPADLLDLSPPLRKLMNHITRGGEVSAQTAAKHIGESLEDTSKMLNALVEKGYLERTEKSEGWVYRTRFARKRGREVPPGIWSALDKRTKKEK